MDVSTKTVPTTKRHPDKSNKQRTRNHPNGDGIPKKEEGTRTKRRTVRTRKGDMRRRRRDKSKELENTRRSRTRYRMHMEREKGGKG
jgi:hypothetical protein